MQSTKKSLSKSTVANSLLPGGKMFSLPEKVLQFGTGALLRGLPDYFIDRANRQGIFNGRVVVVKSTNNGDTKSFEEQDGLYTLCVRGIENGKKVEEDIVCAAISRVLSAGSEWNKILECAHDPQIKIILSNTTEVGIQLVEEDIRLQPPVSFPGKLLAFLLERYIFFNGDAEAGLVIIPTELIDDNAQKLRDICTRLAVFNKLDDDFIAWLLNSNYFCNSLVDRIVPGRDQAISEALTTQTGLQDELMIVAEPYKLWAIEACKDAAAILSFAAADEGVVLTDNILKFKELKLRLLNATHTLSCAMAFLSGFTTVKEAMDDEKMSAFIADLMLDEIAAAVPYDLNPQEAIDFGKKVIDRFRNPFIRHQWISISLNYTQKMRVRVVPVLLTYYERYATLPGHIARGFAAYLLFMKAVKQEGNKFYGRLADSDYPINDEKAAYYFGAWKTNDPQTVVHEALQNTDLWNSDLTILNGFEQAVCTELQRLLQR